jgi:hypothetical protein
MATLVRRRFAATPVRSASATWAAIVDVIAPRGAQGREELLEVAGVASSLIAAEALETVPAVVSGGGPQLRIYCLYDEEAIVGDDVNEDGLSWSPTDGDWKMELPCPPQDIEWVQSALVALSERIVAIDVSVAKSVQAVASARSGPEIDMEGFLRG